MKHVATALFVLAASGSAYSQPRTVNTRLETRAAGNDLTSAIRTIRQSASTPVWAAYSVPSVPRQGDMCCSHNDGHRSYNGCFLEERPRDAQNRTSARPIPLEDPKDIHVLVRLENQQITKIRTFSPLCELDGGGTVLVWFGNVPPQQSLAFLASLESEAERKLREAAIVAVALHSDKGADAVLDKYVDASQPQWLRQHTVFWLGAARGRSGFEKLRQLLKNDTDARVRDKVLFALTVTKDPEAPKLLIESARNDASAHVRGQALFWLAQQASREAAGAIQASIDNDPEASVKEKAVFALSQLPKDEGVPLLIQLAKTNRSPAVRKKAMFWLGQSKDPRAVSFFEQVLAR